MSSLFANNDFPTPKPTSAASTTAFQTLGSLHTDFINDMAFDFYGRRLATCSGDRTVKVWDLNEKNEWIFHPGSGSEWQAHRGSVTRLSWAHPEFGQLLATCGSDHAATVWEERDTPFSSPPTNKHMIGGVGASTDGQTRWIAKVQLSDARKAVSCIQFAPRHLGLKLASGSADGLCRIYEAIDVMNLNQWVMNGSIKLDRSGELGVTSLSWCGSRFEPPSLVIGSSGGEVSVYRYGDASRQWCKAVELDGHARGVLDVAWAPNVGRSYHLIASAGKDDVLRVHKFKRVNGTGSLELMGSQILHDGDCEVWRVAWNVTGSVLSSTGDGGVVRMWKSDFNGKWKCVAEVKGGGSQEKDATN